MNIDSSKYRQIVILTGGDILEKHDVEQYGHIDRLKDHPELIWELFGALRDELKTAQPTAAHEALAQLEKNLSPEQKFTLITQNIDGLHPQAGSRNVIELHGNIHRTKCADPDCVQAPYIDQDNHQGEVPRCTHCGAPLRPDVVLLGEPIPAKRDWLAKQAVRGCDLFIAIGVSGSVYPALNFVRSADYAGARTICINREPASPTNPYFKEKYLGKAEDLLPELFGVTAQKKTEQK